MTSRPLFSHQQLAVDKFLQQCSGVSSSPGFLLLHAPGLGKTATAVRCALETARRDGESLSNSAEGEQHDSDHANDSVVDRDENLTLDNDESVTRIVIACPAAVEEHWCRELKMGIPGSEHQIEEAILNYTPAKSAAAAAAGRRRGVIFTADILRFSSVVVNTRKHVHQQLDERGKRLRPLSGSGEGAAQRKKARNDVDSESHEQQHEEGKKSSSSSSRINKNEDEGDDDFVLPLGLFDNDDAGSAEATLVEQQLLMEVDAAGEEQLAEEVHKEDEAAKQKKALEQKQNRNRTLETEVFKQVKTRLAQILETAQPRINFAKSPAAQRAGSGSVLLSERRIQFLVVTFSRAELAVASLKEYGYRPSLLIVDEAQLVCNSNSFNPHARSTIPNSLPPFLPTRLFKAMASLASLCAWRLLLSGHPIQNRVADLGAMLALAGIDAKIRQSADSNEQQQVWSSLCDPPVFHRRIAQPIECAISDAVMRQQESLSPASCSSAANQHHPQHQLRTLSTPASRDATLVLHCLLGRFADMCSARDALAMEAAHRKKSSDGKTRKPMLLPSCTAYTVSCPQTKFQLAAAKVILSDFLQLVGSVPATDSSGGKGNVAFGLKASFSSAAVSAQPSGSRVTVQVGDKQLNNNNLTHSAAATRNLFLELDPKEREKWEQEQQQRQQQQQQQRHRLAGAENSGEDDDDDNAIQKSDVSIPCASEDALRRFYNLAMEQQSEEGDDGFDDERQMTALNRTAALILAAEVQKHRKQIQRQSSGAALNETLQKLKRSSDAAGLSKEMMARATASAAAALSSTSDPPPSYSNMSRQHHFSIVCANWLSQICIHPRVLPPKVLRHVTARLEFQTAAGKKAISSASSASSSSAASSSAPGSLLHNGGGENKLYICVRLIHALREERSTRRKDGTKAVVVFSHSLQALKLLAAELENPNLPASSATVAVAPKMPPKLKRGKDFLLITGDDDPATRHAALTNFSDVQKPQQLQQQQQPESKQPAASSANCWLLLASTRACGVGYNINACDAAIILCARWNPQHEIQAQARIRRLQIASGADQEVAGVEVFRLVCQNSVDTAFRQVQEQKLQLVHSILQRRSATAPVATATTAAADASASSESSRRRHADESMDDFSALSDGDELISILQRCHRQVLSDKGSPVGHGPGTLLGSGGGERTDRCDKLQKLMLWKASVVQDPAAAGAPASPSADLRDAAAVAHDDSDAAAWPDFLSMDAAVAHQAVKKKSRRELKAERPSRFTLVK